MASTRLAPVRTEPAQLGLTAGLAVGAGLCILKALAFAAVHGGPMVVAPLIVLCAGLLWWLAPSLFFGVMAAALLFQNLMVALSLGEGAPDMALKSGQAINLALLVAGAGLALLDMGVRGRLPWRLLLPFAVFVVLLAIMTVYGATHGAEHGQNPAGWVSALTYARLFLTPVLALIVGLGLAQRIGWATASRILSLFGVLLLLWSLFEILWPAPLYEALNITVFQTLKKPLEGLAHDGEALWRATLRPWLNLGGPLGVGFDGPRLLGPTIHAISFAYACASLSVAAVASGRRVLGGLLLAVVVLIGAKGPMVLALLTIFGWAIRPWIGERGAVFGVAIIGVAYAGAVIAYGWMTRDIHVLGLAAGVKSLIAQPFGHGVGVGGNLSAGAQGWSYIDFQTHGPPFALESALGVLAYQMGVMGALLLAGLWGVWRALARIGGRAGVLIAGAVWVVTINALFQEEAFSPTAAGLILLMAGLMLGARPPQAP